MKMKNLQSLLEANNKLKANHGFTLIELLISISIFFIVGASIYGLFNWSIKTLTNSKQEVEAITIANHKIEMIRNFSYNNIGTVGGIPNGTIPQTETIIKNNTSFTVKTYVKYYDDPYDGLAPVDTLPTDYKIVQITVSWTNFWGTKSTNLSTIIAPKGIETNAGGGTLVITVFNANGQPIENVDVYIKNNILNPPISINTRTDSVGRISFPGAPAGSGYKIVASKNGYSTDQTCGVNPSKTDCNENGGNPNPTKPDATILEGQATEISFTIDLLSVLNIKTVNQNFPAASLANSWTDGDQDNPAFTMDSAGNYYFVWRDNRSGQTRIYSQKYNSSHVRQWGSEDMQVSASNNQNYPSVAVDNNGNVYIAWVDNRENGNLNMYLKKFDSNGNPVYSDKKITTQNNSSNQYAPQIVVTNDGNFVYITWQDDINDAGDIYLQKINSSDGSNVWSTEKKVNSDEGTNLQTLPQLAITSDNNYIYVAWQDNRNSNNDIYLQKFDSEGNKINSGNWIGDVLINDDTSGKDQLNPKIVISPNNNNIYIVWQDGRGGTDDIYWQRLDPEGAKAIEGNWSSGNILVNQSQTGTQSLPSAVVDTLNNIYISWTDERNNGDIYLQKFNSLGNRLWSLDTKINNDNNNNTTQTNSVLAINSTNNKVVIAWQDNTMGNNNIYFASFSSPITVNLGNINFNLRGDKTIGNNPIIYKYNSNHATASDGTLNLNNIEWDAYSFTINPSSGLVLLTSDMSLPLNVNPGETASVMLYLKSNTGNSYLAIVKNVAGETIKDGLVRLYSDDKAYDQVISTNVQGQAFFTSLSNASYNLEISASGYNMATSSVSISGEVIEETVLTS
ncbi:MAG: carboxypeptidase regulatory-like domain-containing protein [Patescibacteria group bacterium]